MDPRGRQNPHQENLRQRGPLPRPKIDPLCTVLEGQDLHHPGLDTQPWPLMMLMILTASTASTPRLWSTPHLRANPCQDTLLSNPTDLPHPDQKGRHHRDSVLHPPRDQRRFHHHPLDSTLAADHLNPHNLDLQLSTRTINNSTTTKTTSLNLRTEWRPTPNLKKAVYHHPLQIMQGHPLQTVWTKLELNKDQSYLQVNLKGL